MEESTKKPTRNFLRTILVLLIKSTKLVKLVKAVKLLKFTKAFTTFFSMSLSVFVYSFMMGPWFAFGFVVMIFIHEMGHVMAMNKKGYPVSAPVFIPMLGAIIFSPKFKNKEDEAYIGFGGPFVGGLAALVLFAYWLLSNERSEILLLVSYTATVLNLFNLIPMRPFDGGRITQIIGGWFKWFGLAILIWLSWEIKDPVILFIWIMVLQDINLPPNFRFNTALTAWFAMTGLMLAGYGDQHWIVEVMDIAFGAFVTFIYYGQARGLIESEEEEIKEEVILTPLDTRMKWLALYLLLVAGLTVLTLVQIPHLPIVNK